MVSKFGITLPEGYEEALIEWAEELGDKKATLAAESYKGLLRKKVSSQVSQDSRFFARSE